MKVLIVDDSALNRTILKDYLLEVGFEVFEAGTQHEAEEIYNRIHPELVIKDLFMADWDAIESIGFFRSNGPKTKIIICSTDSYKDKLIEGLKAGAHDFLLKPLERDRVLATINRLNLS